MPLFSSKKREFFTPEQQQLMVEAIQKAEKNTSGEVRVFVESKCNYVDAVDRAKEIFFNLKMDQTKDRNAVLFYIAMDDRQLALFADEGIYQKLGEQYWNDEVRKMITAFSKDNHTDGICRVINNIGNALQNKFPYESDDKNELPDEIIFGN
ncbi:MAG: TPM domain-containing protein [Bacteroidota bacterium]|nr:TPM domain-containing protein [Bacteroidota bacterium]